MAPPAALVATPLAISQVNHKEEKHLSKPILSQSIETLSSTPTIPIINLHGLNDLSAKASILDAIDKACTNWGLFLVVNHGIEASVTKEMLEAVKAFFALPLEEKTKYMTKDGTLVNYMSNPNDNWREVLRHQGRPANDEIIRLWPSEPSNYKDAAKAYLEATWQLVMKLARAISEKMGKEERYIEGMIEEGFQYMLCNYYPPCPQPNQAPGMGPHTDQCHIAVLTDNDVDGLQLWHEGKWVTVPHVPGALVVFLGKCMESASEGRYMAAKHQVLVSEKVTRISLAVGNGPKLRGFDTMIHI